MKIFISSSLRNFELNRKIAEVLENNGYVVYLPQRDTPQSNDISSVFKANIDGIRSSDVVVAILVNYGRDLCFEVGYAYGIGKPVIGLTLGNNEYLGDEMIAGALKYVVNTINDLLIKLSSL